MSEYKVFLEDITYTYNPGTPFAMGALDHVTVGFDEGKITGIIGHTGSGKSTMVQLMNGLIRADSGRILLDGNDIWAKPKEIGKIRHRVGLVMQYPEYQLFEETVSRDIAFGPRNMGLDEDEIMARILDSARFVGLDESQLEKSPFDLSGGQKRRAAIAGVMAMRPEVLILDEPAAGLDPQGRDSIFEGIVEYKRATGATVLIVSHSMEDMARFCDRIVVMSHSRVLAQGTKDEVFSQADVLTAAGLDVPQVTYLTELLRARGIPIRKGIYTVADAVAELKGLLAGKAGKRS